MSDLINREHLFEEIDALMRSPWFNDGKEHDENLMLDTGHLLYLERKAAVEMVRDFCVKTEPSVTSTADWISCLDRMPEKDKEVFVYLFDNSPYIAWWDGERWHTEDFILDEDDEPLEWYELPKPLDGKK